jgi:hypothetical protein
MKYIGARDLRTMRDINFHGGCSGRAALSAESPRDEKFRQRRSISMRQPAASMPFQKTLTDFLLAQRGAGAIARRRSGESRNLLSRLARRSVAALHRVQDATLPGSTPISQACGDTMLAQQRQAAYWGAMARVSRFRS